MADIQHDELWSFLRSKSRQIEMKLDTLTRKRTGSYYTDLELTDEMMRELVDHLLKSNPLKKIYEYRFLEPCVGSGNFVFSYIRAVIDIGIDKDSAQTMLDNIYVADVNLDALKGYKESLQKAALTLWGIELHDEYFKTHIGSALLIDVTASDVDYIGIDKVFPAEIVGSGFDIIATNPPYKHLKAERSQYNNDEEYSKDKDKYKEIAKIVSNRFQYSIGGILNLYKLFTEEILDKYANENAIISLLIPSSILTDKLCTPLRTHILTSSRLVSVKMLSEGSKYIDANQSLAAILIQKNATTEEVEIVKDYINNPKNSANVFIADIMNENTGNAIIAVSSKEYEILRKLRTFPIVKELPFIINLRGELDLTANKRHVVSYDTGYPLVRGRNIGYYALLKTSSSEFVTEEFINLTKKKVYIESERIVCQQIANMKKERRVTFAIVPSCFVLGNSCNFISVKENSYNIDIYALLGLLNTELINWFFKLTSSNNHVNNYEIDCFPIPTEASELERISELVKEYIASQDDSIVEKIEQLAYKAYGIPWKEEPVHTLESQCINEYLEGLKHVLPWMTYQDSMEILNGNRRIEDFIGNLSEFEGAVAVGLTYKYKNLFWGKLLNHTTFKLSDLDLEMIKAVPQGGNWKDIPMETVEKSKRLKHITQTGGRTTLYGRIDYDKPSYTITTYFNRPGNGTYVHPIHERVLSVREAARFQTFRDNYYFYGNKSQTLKQVGNAVPTILAYQIAREIKRHTSCSKSIDLFCGAGGMTAGFKAAGIHSLLSTDIEESACITLKINNPEINVLCGDITQAQTKAVIERCALEGEADIICGGPPCQGFSMAGFRSNDDPRNQLFRDFVDIVSKVNPKVIVFENVEGLLSYQGGKTYREVHELFSGLGYKTEGRTLMASDYAVPQRRKRVIIICTRADLNIAPSKLFPKPITAKESIQVTARETISDLETVPCDDTARYVEKNDPDIVKFFKGSLTYKEYIRLKTYNKNFRNLSIR